MNKFKWTGFTGNLSILGYVQDFIFLLKILKFSYQILKTLFKALFLRHCKVSLAFYRENATKYIEYLLAGNLLRKGTLYILICCVIQMRCLL